MITVLRNRILILLTAVTLMVIFLYTAIGYFFQDQFVTDKLRLILQNYLKSSGLQVSIGKIHWAGVNNISGSDISLRDDRSHQVVANVNRINIEFNLISLLWNHLHPEACLLKVEMINPYLYLSRQPDGNWNFAKYFVSTGKKIHLQTTLEIKNARVNVHDYQFGNYRLNRINGRIKLRNYPLLTWDLRGFSDFRADTTWSSRGKFQVEQLAGIGFLEAKQVVFKKISPLLSCFNPLQNDFTIHSGLIGFQIKFSWDRHGLWLQRGIVTVSDADIFWVKLKDPFFIREMEIELTPSFLNIKQAQVLYHHTNLKIRGQINSKTSAIKGEVNIERLRMADLNVFLPRKSSMAILGIADIRLSINGTITNPIVDGDVFVNQAKLSVNNSPTISQISGRMMIHHNNIKIKRLEGVWNHGLVGVNGEIYNLFNPTFQIKLYGNELSLRPEETAMLDRLAIQIGGKINFTADITGNIKNIKMNSAVTFDQISYNYIPVDDFRLKLAWDSLTESLQILELDGMVGEGTIHAKGEIIVNQKGAKWQISGNIADFDLKKVLLNQQLPIEGKISSDLILKGQWRKNTPFEFGSIFGIFNGKQIKWHDAFVDEAEGVFSWVNGKLIIDSIQAKVANGIIYGHLAWDSTETDVSINGENVAIEQLFPEHKKYPLQGIFNGSLTLNGPPSDLSGKITGTFSEIVWSGRNIGSINGTINYKNRHLISDEIRIATPAGDFLISGGMQLSPEPVLSIHVLSKNTNLKGMMNWFTLQPGLKLDGQATVDMDINGMLSNPTIDGRISLANPVLGPIQMQEGKLSFEGNWDELTLTDLTLTNQDAIIKITGKMKQNNLDFNLQGKSLRLAPMGLDLAGKAIHGVVNFKGKISGDVKTPTLIAAISGRDIKYGSLQYQVLSAKIKYANNNLEVISANLIENEHSTIFHGQISTTEPYRIDFEAKITSLSIQPFIADYWQLPADLKVEGYISGLVKIAGNLKEPEVSVNGALTKGIINDLPIQGEYDLIYAKQKVNIKKLLLTQGNGTLLATGLWETGRLLKIEIGIQDFSLGLINSFINSPYQFTGVANSYISLEWTNNRISGDYRFDAENLGLKNYSIGNLHVAGNFSDQGLTIFEGVLNRKDGILNCSGYIPWAPKLLNQLKLAVVQDANYRNLNISSNLSNIPADWINLFAPYMTITNGYINGSLNLYGNFINPQLFGELNCNDIRANITSLPLPIDSFQANVSLNGYQASITKAKGNYGKGRFALSGEIDLDGVSLKTFQLGLTGSKIYYKNSFFDGFGDFNLNLTGTIDNSLLSGETKIYNSKIGISALNSNQVLTDSKLLPDLAITVHTGREVRYRQMGIADIPVNGTIQIKGSIVNPMIEGEASSDTGVLTLYGQSFQVRSAKAIFKYSQGYNPYIDVDSRVKTHQTEVKLTVKGLIGSNLAINLTSQPYMPPSELYAMLNWSDLYGDKPLTINGMVTGNMGFVTDSVFGDIFYDIRNALNLDYLYLEPNFQKNDVRLNFGDYLTEDFYLSYSRSVTTIPKEIWGLEYQLTPRLSLGGNFSMIDGTSWSLLYRFSY